MLRRFFQATTLIAFAVGVALSTGGWILLSAQVATPVSISLSFAPLTGCGGMACQAGQVPDNAAAGTVIATATVQMSDGTTNYHGTLASAPGDSSGIFPTGNLSGLQVPLNRPLHQSDDGAHSTVITAN